MDMRLREWIDSLAKSFGGPRPPVRDGHLRAHHARGDVPSLVRDIKSHMGIEPRLRIGFVNSGGPARSPAWIIMPSPMPIFGSKDYKECTLDLFIRKRYIADAPYAALAKTVAHEFAHILLESTYHPLRDIEKAVDLTAMLLGYRDIFIAGKQYVLSERWDGSELVRNVRTGGYLTMAEVHEAARYMRLGC